MLIIVIINVNDLDLDSVIQCLYLINNLQESLINQKKKKKKLFSNGEFLLVAQQKHCETSCKRDVTLCNGEKMCCSVAAIVAKSRT